MGIPEGKGHLSNSIRFRALCSLFFSVLIGFGLAVLTSAVLRMLKLMPAEPQGQMALIFFLAMVFTSIILIATMPLLLTPIERLNSRLRQSKSRSKIRELNPDEFAELAPLVETLVDYVDWAENQQHMSAAIHGAFRKRIEHLAEFDTLTGLFNRHYLEVVLPLQIEQAGSVGGALSFIMLDVDNFKHYNDTNGHPDGDIVLSKIADILQHSVRGNDICCRYGGEEFSIVLPGATGKIAHSIAERIRFAIEAAHFEHEETQPSGMITASLGIASYPHQGDNPKELIQNADRAMYLAKRLGRNRTCKFEDVDERDLDEPDYAAPSAPPPSPDE